VAGKIKEKKLQQVKFRYQSKRWQGLGRRA